MHVLERHGKTFTYMTTDEIEYIPKTSRCKSPQYYIDYISNKHTNIKVLGFHIKDSSEYHGNYTDILYEYKGILMVCPTKQLYKANKVGGVSYRKIGFEYAIKCILDYYNPKIKLVGYNISDQAFRFSSIDVKCSDCGRKWNVSQTTTLVYNGIQCKCERPNTIKFDGTHNAYFYIHKFMYDGEVIYKYGVTHNPDFRFYLFKKNNKNIDFETIMCLEFDNSLMAADLEHMLKYTNLINHMTHVKIKDGHTELTDEAGLKFIIEELTYMGKL